MRRSKKSLGWPENGQPSSRHVWKFFRTSASTGVVEHCLRCGANFVERADVRGPVYCHPTRTWMETPPDDDGALGENRTMFG
jgi:hypothetical protein